MLSLEEISKINLSMLDLGAPIQKDNIGYNKGDFGICQAYLYIDSDFENIVDLLKRLLNYKNTQLLSYKKDLIETHKYYSELNKEVVNEVKKKISFLFDVPQNENICVLYIPDKIDDVFKNKSFIKKIESSRLYEVDKTHLNATLDILKLLDFTIPTQLLNIAKTISENIDCKEAFSDFDFKKSENLSILNKENQRLIKGNTMIIEIEEVTEQGLILNYPRNIKRNKDIIYKILKDLNYEFRKYITPNKFIDYNFMVLFKGIKPLITELKEFNKSHKKCQIDFSILTQYLKDNPTKIEDTLLKNDILAKIEKNGKVSLNFLYDSIIITTIKKLNYSNRKWDNDKKLWIIDLPYLKILKEYLLTENANYNLINFDEIIEEYNSNDNSSVLSFVMKRTGNSNNVGLLRKYKVEYTSCAVINDILKKYISKYQVMFLTDIISAFDEFEKQNIAVDKTDLNIALKEINYDFLKQDFEMISLDKLYKKPFDYQIEGVKDLLKIKQNLLCDTMGLGKTIEAILFGASIPGKKLIVCPAVLKLNWQKEIIEALGEQEVKIISKKYESLDTNNGWTIINYDILNKYKEEILEEGFNVMLCDEAHFIKSIKSGGVASSSRAIATLSISDRIPYKTLITGTPITNRTKDLWNLLCIIAHPLAKDFYEFIFRYCGAISNDFGLEFNGYSNTEDLYLKLKDYMVRRLKEDVSLELPEKTRVFIPTEINTKKYNKELQKYFDAQNNGEEYSLILALISALRITLAKEKVSSTIDIVNNLLEENESVVIFTNYTYPVEKFLEYYGDNAVSITGKTPKNQVNKIIEKFQTGKAKVFIGNIKAAGVGITLNSSSCMVFNDYDWLPNNHIQAEDRIYRIGQKNDCTIYYNFAKNTDMDVYITKLISEKLNNISKIIDNKSKEFIDENDNNFSILKELMNNYKK